MPYLPGSCYDGHGLMLWKCKQVPQSTQLNVSFYQSPWSWCLFTAITEINQSHYNEAVFISALTYSPYPGGRGESTSFLTSPSQFNPENYFNTDHQSAHSTYTESGMVAYNFNPALRRQKQVNLSSRPAWSTQNFTTAKDTQRDPVLGGGGNTHKNSNVSCAECSITDQPPCFKYSTGQLLPNEIWGKSL